MAQLQGPAVNPAPRLRANVEENLGVFRGWCRHGRLWAALGGGTRTPPHFLLLSTGGRRWGGAGASDCREPSLMLFPSSDLTGKRKESDGRRKVQRRRKTSHGERAADVRLAGPVKHGSFSIQLEVLPLLAGRHPASRQAGCDGRPAPPPHTGGEQPHRSGRDTEAQRGHTHRPGSHSEQANPGFQPRSDCKVQANM